MKFSVYVENREVLASGVIVLGAEDRETIFELDNMKFTMILKPQNKPLNVNFVRNGFKNLTIELCGEFPEFTAAWKLSGIAQAEDRQIDLDVMIYSQSNNASSIRQVSFSFTANPILPARSGF